MQRFFVLSILLLSSTLFAAEKPLKVLYLSGPKPGLYHSYLDQEKLFRQHLQKNISAEVTTVWGAEAMKSPDLAKEADVMVMNFCYWNNGDEAIVENLGNIISAGKPAIMVHCVMHSFKENKKEIEWTKISGLNTRKHDPLRRFEIKTGENKHPIVQFMPETWMTPEDELYQNLRFDGQPVLTATSAETNSEHVVAWTHSHGKGKVFGITLGHTVETFQDKTFHKILANAVLWSTGRLSQ